MKTTILTHDDLKYTYKLVTPIESKFTGNCRNKWEQRKRYERLKKKLAFKMQKDMDELTTNLIYGVAK
jgi:hypothetical protein